MSNGFTPISATPNPLDLEREIIDENTLRPNPLENAALPLQSGIDAGLGIAEQGLKIDQLQEATKFEELLKSGEEGMSLALQDAQAQGIDLTGIPDPKLYLNSKEDSASWYAQLAARVEKHEKKIARAEGFEGLSSDDTDMQKKGISKLVGSGIADPIEGASEIRNINFKKELQSFISGEKQMVDASSVDEVPDGATVVDVNQFKVSSPNINEILESYGRPPVPDDIKIAAEKAAEKLNMPTDILISVAARESDFNPAAVSKNDARGLGQLLSKHKDGKNISTGPKMFKLAQEKGFIGKDVDYDVAVENPEMNLLMTGLLFQENLKLKEVGGDPVKALIVHRAGPQGLKDFEAGQPIMVKNDDGTTEDISEDVGKWRDTVVGVGFHEGIPGMASDGSFDLFTVEGINRELGRLTSDVKFSTAPETKVKIQVLENRKDDLLKKQAQENKGKSKGALSDIAKKQNMADTIELVIALAEDVEPSGRIKGNIKNIGSWLGFESQASVSTLNQFKGLLAGQVAKGVGGESGRLTDQDRAFALASLPTALDNKSERANKIAILEAMVIKMRAAKEGDPDAISSLRELVFRQAALNGKVMDIKSLRKSYKARPSDALIEAWLASNGKPINKDTVAQAKRILEGGSTVGVPAEKQKATVLPSGRGSMPGIQAPDASGQINSPARVSPQGGFGGAGNIPGIEGIKPQG